MGWKTKIKKWKKFLCGFISLMLIMGILCVTFPPLQASGEEYSSDDFEIKDGVLKKYKGAATDVKIPEGVTRIGEGAFRGCRSLASVTIPKGVTHIGEYTFWGCSSLTDITIPNGVTAIGDYAFYGCSSLMGITIPKSVTSIGEHVFDECDEQLIIYGKKAPMLKNTQKVAALNFKVK